MRLIFVNTRIVTVPLWDTRAYCSLKYCISTQCPVADRTPTTPKIIFTLTRRREVRHWRRVFLLADYGREPSVKSGPSPKKGTMQGLQAFQTAAREGGFVVVTESEGGTVLWLKKSAPDSVREAHQRMCIDSLTNSVTVYWMAAQGKVNSKTFRAVPALQEWFKVIPQPIVQR